MKTFKFSAVALALAAWMASGAVWAFDGHQGHWMHGHGHHGHFSVIVGAPFVFLPQPYFYDPPSVVVTSPPVYVERGTAAPPGGQLGYWYYCDAPPGYYPYVSECPAGWQQVVPSPPPPQ